MSASKIDVKKTLKFCEYATKELNKIEKYLIKDRKRKGNNNGNK